MSLPAAFPSILREFATFLKRPDVLTPSGLRAPGAFKAWAAMVALHIGGLLLVVTPIIYGWQAAFDLPSPDAFGKVPGWLLPPLVIVIAPVLEEIVFRGWQTGRPRALWLLLCAIALTVLLIVRESLPPVIAAVALGGLVLAAIAGWFLLRRQPRPDRYAPAYPSIFHGVVLFFAALHLLNYPSAALIGLPLVLPQVWGGLVLGFQRMRFGLPASILGHAAANTMVLAIGKVLG